ncbi:MAG TPA: hypothetical protein ENG96_03800 [Gammaproteobacteria bacterium]|nr:hypothetical protein [Gammaproteobacteria bacterium]
MKYKRPDPHAIILSLIPALFISVLFVMNSSQSFADEPVVETGENPETRLKYWLYDNNGFFLKLTQRLPDQTRAYFEARGFDQASSDIAGTSCIFQTMIKNTGTDSGVVMNADLSEWKVVSGGNSKSLLLREYWKKRWLDRKQSQSASVAFEWSLLPTNIQYDVNDYNWGMSSYGLPPGSHFDLLFSWTRKGEHYNGKISDVICPDDIHPEPLSQ